MLCKKLDPAANQLAASRFRPMDFNARSIPAWPTRIRFDRCEIGV
jgi:hypothetical protein